MPKVIKEEKYNEAMRYMEMGFNVMDSAELAGMHGGTLYNKCANWHVKKKPFDWNMFVALRNSVTHFVQSSTRSNERNATKKVIFSIAK